MAMLLFAIMSVFGGGTSMRSPKYQMMMRLSQDSDQQVKHMATEKNSAMLFFLNTFSNALIALVGGLILFMGFS